MRYLRHPVQFPHCHQPRHPWALGQAGLGRRSKTPSSSAYPLALASRALASSPRLRACFWRPYIFPLRAAANCLACFFGLGALALGGGFELAHLFVLGEELATSTSSPRSCQLGKYLGWYVRQQDQSYVAPQSVSRASSRQSSSVKGRRIGRVTSHKPSEAAVSPLA